MLKKILNEKVDSQNKLIKLRKELSEICKVKKNVEVNFVGDDDDIVYEILSPKSSDLKILKSKIEKVFTKYCKNTEIGDIEPAEIDYDGYYIFLQGTLKNL
jgi:hypothetical protein